MEKIVDIASMSVLDRLDEMSKRLVNFLMDENRRIIYNLNGLELSRISNEIKELLYKISKIDDWVTEEKGKNLTMCYNPKSFSLSCVKCIVDFFRYYCFDVKMTVDETIVDNEDWYEVMINWGKT